VGLLSLPYAWIFEFFGALVEGFGYFVNPLAFLFNELSLFFFLLYLAVSTLLGILISLGGLILEQNTNKGAMTVKQCMQLTPYAMLENFGYRQFITLCRVEGILRYHGLKTTWSKVKREPFNL
jgi:hypothetical protein